MKLVRLLFLSILAALALASAAAAQTRWTASLAGANEVPGVSTPASGTFTATLNDDHTQMTFELSFVNLMGVPYAAEIRRGAAGSPGPVVYVLPATSFTSPIRGDTDPAPAGGPTGFVSSDFADLQAGRLYVNIRTSVFPSGEIRGQIGDQAAVSPGTWGRIKSLFH